MANVKGSKTKEVVKEEVVATAPVVPAREIFSHTEIEVFNNTNGVLVWHSPRTKNQYLWSSYGQMQLMEYSELQSMRASDPKFFDRGWVLITDEDVIKKMRLEKYRKEVMTPEQLEEFFDMSPKEMQAVLDKASNGAKALIIGRAMDLYTSGELDSTRKIKLLEKKLGIEIEATADDDE